MKATKRQIAEAHRYEEEFDSFASNDWQDAVDGLPFYELRSAYKLYANGNLEVILIRFDDANGEGWNGKPLELLGHWLIGRKGEDLSWQLNRRETNWAFIGGKII